MSWKGDQANANWILAQHYDRFSQKVFQAKGGILDIQREVRFVKAFCDAFMGKNGKRPDKVWIEKSQEIWKRKMNSDTFKQQQELERDWDLFDLATERLVVGGILVRSQTPIDVPGDGESDGGDD